MVFSVTTFLLDFPFDSSIESHEDIEEVVIEVLKNNSKFREEKILKLFSIEDLTLLKAAQNSTITLKTYRRSKNEGIATITIEYLTNEAQSPLLSYEESKILEQMFCESSKSKHRKKVKTLPSIQRGLEFDIYFPTSDLRILEYDVDEMLFDSYSDFQHVQVAHSKTYGNMLILNDDPNLAESDVIYTTSLMRKDQINYENTEILILGGGDGALLNALLKEKPKKVTMVEIDEMVINVSKKYLRSLCGDILDGIAGDNYEIIMGDCFPVMEKMKSSSMKFDFIFGDLTTIPISSNNENEDIDFLRKILKLVFSILSPNGKYLTHGLGASGEESELIFRNLIKELIPNLSNDKEFQIDKVVEFIPSYNESWSFYTVQ